MHLLHFQHRCIFPSSNFKQVCFIQKMKQYTHQKVYKIAISKWYNFNRLHGYNSRYFNDINQEIKDLSGLQITFDSRYADAIIFWINFRLCSTFKHYEQDWIWLDIYFKMAQHLYQMKLIGKRHLSEIKSVKPFEVVEKISDFTKQIVQSNISGEEIEQKWVATFGLSLLQFWQLILIKQIKHIVLLKLYQVTEKAPSIIEQEKLKKYIENLKKVQEDRMEDLQSNLKVVNDSKQHQQDTLDQKKLLNQDQGISVFNRKLQMGFSKYQEQTSMPRISMNQNTYKDIQKKLRQVSFKRSLFKNPAYGEILKGIQNFINFVSFSIFTNKDYALQTFGSIRNSLALSNQYDIDITFVSSNPMNNERNISVSHLFKINGHLKKMPFCWYKSSRVYCFQDLPMPYLKIEVDEVEFNKIFSIQNTTKIDITIGNKTAVMNSQLISHFAKIPEIHQLCILIKFWAKARNIINLQKPMLGLSSYMLTLMCIYYLMESGQIDFLQLSETDLQNIENTIIVPNMKRRSIKSILDNFIGFLQFYKQTGKFQRERKVVCLLKSGIPQGYKFNQDFIVNAYDFLDRCNPGRLKVANKNKHFSEFERALLLLKSKNLLKINQIFQIQ